MLPFLEWCSDIPSTLDIWLYLHISLSWIRLWHFLHTRCNGYTGMIVFLELRSDLSCTPDVMVIPLYFGFLTWVVTFPLHQMNGYTTIIHFLELGSDISSTRNMMIVLLSSTAFLHPSSWNPHHTWGIYYNVRRAVVFLSIPIPFVGYHPPCHYCFPLAIMFEFVSAKILPRRCKQMRVAGQPTYVIQPRSL